MRDSREDRVILTLDMQSLLGETSLPSPFGTGCHLCFSSSRKKM